MCLDLLRCLLCNDYGAAVAAAAVRGRIREQRPDLVIQSGYPHNGSWCDAVYEVTVRNYEYAPDPDDTVMPPNATSATVVVHGSPVNIWYEIRKSDGTSDRRSYYTSGAATGAILVLFPADANSE